MFDSVTGTWISDALPNWIFSCRYRIKPQIKELFLNLYDTKGFDSACSLYIHNDLESAKAAKDSIATKLSYLWTLKYGIIDGRVVIFEIV